MGGLKPSWANIRQTIAFANAQSVPVIVTVRPRIWLLTSHHQINTMQLQKILMDLPPINLILNRAFDQINNQSLAIEWLIANNFQRIVTHGGSSNKPLNIKHLQEVIQWSHRKIEILPSGVILLGKVADISKILNLNQIQASNIV